MMSSKCQFILLTIAMLIFQNCPGPTSPDNSEYLSIENVFSTSVDLHVSLPDPKIDQIIIKRDDKKVINTQIANCEDTLLTDTSLEPSTEYKYQAFFLKENVEKMTSDSLFFQTLPTTSHDFTWDIDTIGIYISNCRDVSILSEDNIYVSGEFYIPDPDSNFSGTGREFCNIAHWHDNNWIIKRQFVIDTADSRETLRGIKVISEDNIWTTNGGDIYHYDGNKTELMFEGPTYHEGNLSRDIHVVSPDDIYFGGRRGWLVHWDGSSIEKIDVGLDNAPNNVAAIEDITSTPDGKRVFVLTDDLILEYTNEKVDTLLKTKTITQKSQFKRFTCFDIYGDKLYISDSWIGMIYYNIDSKKYSVNPNSVSPAEAYFECHVQSPNNIILLGSNGNIMHYNGDTWYQDGTNDLPGIQFYFGGGDVKDNFITMAGDLNGGAAIVIRGHHR